MYIYSNINPAWVDKMNYLGGKKIPFIFILDFELEKPKVYSLNELPSNILYKFNQTKNYTLNKVIQKDLFFHKVPLSFSKYKEAFDNVMSSILYGNSFLVNLTFATEIETNYTLKELFNISHAKYKLYFQDQFILFSPESFVIIKDKKICTYPMKGTIDSSTPDAENVILNDKKEIAEHNTIVDLLRNDLSMVSKNVTVNKFRYIDTIETQHNTLLQVSSEITGSLGDYYHSHLGDIFYALLPAGSISGAPKKKTMDIIKKSESGNRGYYSGVFGIFDGVDVDSAVMIRYLENKENKLYYRSGCGITHLSECAAEYKEMIDKIYVPISRKH